MFGRRTPFGGRFARRTHSGRTWTWRENRELVAILVSVPRLNQFAHRQELLLVMGEYLGLGHAFSVSEDSDARTHLRAIVRTARRAGRLEALREALLVVEPDDMSAEWFELASTVLTAPAGPLPPGFLLDLIGELRNHPPEFGRSAVTRYLSERRSAGRPLDCRSLPQVLCRLYDARVPAGDPDALRAQLLRFLRLLSSEQGQSSRLATLLGSVLGRDRGDRAVPGVPFPATAERQIIIQIRVEEEGAPTDLPYTRRHYSLRGYYYERAGDARPVYLGSRSLPDLFTGEELEGRGRAFLADWQEPAQAARGVSKRVEFLLPHSLLGHPAESWPGGTADVPISRTCQVVVRSLTRYKDSSVHDEWLRRWKALDQDCSPGDALERIGWMSPDPQGEGADGVNLAAAPARCPSGKYPPLRLTGTADVEGWLRSHADLSCLGLGAPYDHDNDLIRDAVRDALLLDGIPLMVWRRDEADPGPLLEVLRDGQAPALLADLPHSVHQARRRGRNDPLSVHNQITLLWDDPTCVFSGQDQPMSGTRGAGEGAA